ncbi:MAG: hypothetical protein IT195_01245 [Microthrixaceae bacterium]|nr:hypothetical protein [Microthrixaceae bacterium]
MPTTTGTTLVSVSFDAIGRCHVQLQQCGGVDPDGGNAPPPKAHPLSRRDVRGALDTCVLCQAHLRDTLLRLAERGLGRARWSADITDELWRNLTEVVDPSAVDHLLGQMTAAFPDAEVTGYQALIDGRGVSTVLRADDVSGFCSIGLLAPSLWSGGRNLIARFVPAVSTPRRGKSLGLRAKAV